VQNSATKGIQGMQAFSNLPISTWLTEAARAVQIRQALIGRFETACIP